MNKEHMTIIAMTVVMVAVPLAAFILNFSAPNATTTTLDTFSLPPPSKIQGGIGPQSALDSQLLNIQARNASAVIGQFAPNATLVLEGATLQKYGLAGTYSGPRIGSLFSTLLRDSTSIKFTALSFGPSSQSAVNATFGFEAGTILGPVIGVATDNATYASSSSGLLVTSEKLNFVSLSAPNISIGPINLLLLVSYLLIAGVLTGVILWFASARERRIKRLTQGSATVSELRERDTSPAAPPGLSGSCTKGDSQ